MLPESITTLNMARRPNLCIMFRIIVTGDLFSGQVLKCSQLVKDLKCVEVGFLKVDIMLGTIQYSIFSSVELLNNSRCPPVGLKRYRGGFNVLSCFQDRWLISLCVEFLYHYPVYDLLGPLVCWSDPHSHFEIWRVFCRLKNVRGKAPKCLKVPNKRKEN